MNGTADLRALSHANVIRRSNKIAHEGYTTTPPLDGCLSSHDDDAHKSMSSHPPSKSSSGTRLRTRRKKVCEPLTPVVTTTSPVHRVFCCGLINPTHELGLRSNQEVPSLPRSVSVIQGASAATSTRLQLRTVMSKLSPTAASEVIGHYRSATASPSLMPSTPDHSEPLSTAYTQPLSVDSSAMGRKLSVETPHLGRTRSPALSVCGQSSQPRSCSPSTNRLRLALARSPLAALSLQSKLSNKLSLSQGRLVSPTTSDRSNPWSDGLDPGEHSSAQSNLRRSSPLTSVSAFQNKELPLLEIPLAPWPPTKTKQEWIQDQSPTEQRDLDINDHDLEEALRLFQEGDRRPSSSSGIDAAESPSSPFVPNAREYGLGRKKSSFHYFPPAPPHTATRTTQRPPSPSLSSHVLTSNVSDPPNVRAADFISSSSGISRDMSSSPNSRFPRLPPPAGKRQSSDSSNPELPNDAGREQCTTNCGQVGKLKRRLTVLP
eukprot:Blabericola_migrator_1__11440@NODE_67_length_15652_cov_76_134937_g60_i0_p5_GENE_NODE_67_length_15652_cov_76_134937_g60_i0NODE_67_length_15652_cov_76_134937_g60_i0_p5_ORF_typecomplete_len489_score38_57_NODE_67_length_15652_cov_76_134937_g60_i01165413120